MTVQAHKVCMLGDFGVGKTSLVARLVRSTFSEKYLTTIGVKVDSKEVALPGREPLKLVIWDIAGRSALDALGMHYLRGAAALLLVADGMREGSLSSALNLLMQSRSLLVVDNAQAAIEEATRQMPDVLLIDVELPGLSGNAAVFKLRSRGYRGRIVT